MTRKAPATEKHKGSQKDETYMAGITGNADFLQQNLDYTDGLSLDEAIAEASRDDSPENAEENLSQ